REEPLERLEPARRRAHGDDRTARARPEILRRGRFALRRRRCLPAPPPRRRPLCLRALRHRPYLRSSLIQRVSRHHKAPRRSTEIHIALSAPKGGEGRGEVGGADACDIEQAPPHLTLPALRAGSLPLPACARRGRIIARYPSPPPPPRAERGVEGAARPLRAQAGRGRDPARSAGEGEVWRTPPRCRTDQRSPQPTP